MRAQQPTYAVPGLKMGFQILEHLSLHPRGRTLKDIAADLGLPVSSSFRMVVALENMGLVRRDTDTKRIRMTQKLLTIGQRAITESSLLEHALDIMRALRDRVVDTVLIGVRDGHEIIVLDEAIGTRMFCFISKLGYRLPAYCSAPGKAVLAYLPADEQRQALATMSFKRFNERTLASPEELREDLARIVDQGYAFDNSEQFDGVYCVGAPIFDRNRYPLAALWTSGLMMNMDQRRLPAIGADVRNHADRISHRLGYTPTQA